jgi:hypothetical protein
VAVLQQRPSALVLSGHETLDFHADRLTSLCTDLAIVLDRCAQVLDQVDRRSAPSFSL